MSSYRVVRSGFDTVIIAFRARLPDELGRQLILAREQSREKRSPEPIELGPGRVSGEILSHGVQGGYDAVFSTGELGEMMQFKTDQKGDKWPIRLKIRAASLMAHGYPGAVNRALHRLRRIIAAIDEARLSEVHVCIDVLTDNAFVLDETRLIRPGRAVVRPYEIFDDTHPLADEFFDTEVRRILRGKRLQTLTVGSHTTGSQAIVYNKRDEATLRRNWMFFEAYGLDRDDRSWALWRYEVRFGGSVLKRRFGVRSFSDLDTNLLPMIDWATNRIRYAAPGQSGLHPTRRVLDPFWQTIRDSIPSLSVTQPSIILPSVAKDILNREKIQTLESSAVGAMIAREAMSGASAEAIMRQLPSRAAAMVQRKIRQYPEKTQKSIERAIERAKPRQDEILP